MIKGLYETHLYVENLETSIDFYKNILGLKQCYFEEKRRAAFFWIGQPKEAMLGLWEKPKSEIDIRHFAFRCDKEFILNQATDFLNKHQLKPYNFLKDGTDRPMVFSWMPAIAIYFNDPDGHILEFICILDQKERPELGVISYEEWTKITEEN
ncbi:Catechol 2,3-dioxygenase [Halpernia humi]|uniref:Catechol 2,3-dioxygenase n=1 Tax=Halpernia humi TaxID=493375 RepID=A0A1H6BEX3_9FLAO|nr:VOC family protein [Halpernia humi]SEG59220.1 Catechol 2,3-dioxygenase [Halpernia humi]